MLDAASADDLRSVIEAAQVGILLVDVQSHRIIDANRTALTMLGRVRRDVIGRVCHRFICPQSEGQCPADNLGNRVMQAECFALRQDGSEFPVLKTVTARTLMGRRCLVETFLDITDQKDTQAELQRQRDFLEGIISTARAIILVLDTEGRIVRINPFMEQLSGYSQDELYGHDWFDTFLPADCREDVRKLFRSSLAGVEAKGSVNCVITRDGTSLDVEWWTRRLHNPEGAVTGLLCVGHDVTERIANERHNRDQLQFIQTLLDTIPSPIFYKDDQGCYLGCNAAFADFVGAAKEEIVGKSVTDLAPPEVTDKVMEQDRELLTNGGTQVYNWKMLRNDGVIRDVTFSRATFNDSSGRVAGLIGIAADITALKQEQEFLRNRAHHDELTGLLNRRGLMAAAGLCLERARGAEMDAFVLFADLNEMKRINDELGHQNGDLALKAVARALKASFRTSDAVGRVGGDEFVAVGVLRSPGEALHLPDRLKDMLALHQPAGFDAPVTVSVGLVEFDPEKEPDLQVVMERADELMYQEKRSRGNARS